MQRLRHRLAAGGVPGPLERSSAERVGARPDEAVPPADGEAQLVFHALAERPCDPGRTSGSRTGGARSAGIRALVAQRLREAEPGAAGGRDLVFAMVVRVVRWRSARELAHQRVEPTPFAVALRMAGGAIGARLEAAQAPGLLRTAQVVPGGQAAEPGGTEGGADVAVGDLVQGDAEHIGEPLRPERRARAAADEVGLAWRRACVGERLLRIAQRVADASSTAAVMAGRSVALSRPTKTARAPASLCGVALAAEIGRERASRRRSWRRRARRAARLRSGRRCRPTSAGSRRPTAPPPSDARAPEGHDRRHGPRARARARTIRS